ncbi:ribonuclease P protein component [Arcanobacterium pinnipediorum]|uniref:Ribonuclease P protein component n=1 Tax=Arcanobacterium pinnipediorum TaxID=1503041 RepID=A0ABY5AJQ1_9ACTO|nr:ribonuclease P protein component [Arcanobacterium pinnipediorum]USR79418.1 ribonuclease P protein component [Arcanobacterium pinnipediorum]
MLPAANRLRTSGDFARTVRHGRRSGNSLLVVYFLEDNEHSEADLCTKVGFIVGKKVGNSVVRHTLSRKLRHLVRNMLAGIKPGIVVVRANPDAATASSPELHTALTRALSHTHAWSEESR